MVGIAQRLEQLYNRIKLSEALSKRPSDSVILLAVSKNQPVSDIIVAYHCGLRHFGENYVQEALEKMPLCPNDVIWHFIGPIQNNKTRKISEHFYWVHSVDNKKTAQRLNDQRPNHLPALQICIQVNINEEANKSGVDPGKLQELATFCCQLPQLKLRGLMCIPRAQQNQDMARFTFHKMAQLQNELRAQGIPLDVLSMGMSDDFELAIEAGATMIRIGTALFGTRANSIK
jgi:hypothetical protein